MVREPLLGRVKTRLAAEIGAAASLRFYRGVSGSLIRRLAYDRRWRAVLAVTPDRKACSRFWPRGVRRVAQGGGDLGARMERLLRGQGHRPVVLIGSDIPEVSAAHIAEAFRLLKRNEAVFGPAADGGFWLIGLNPLPHLPGLFDGVRWSTPHALGDTLNNLSDRKVAFAAALTDVDEISSYRRVGHLGARSTLPAQSSS